MEQGGVGRVAIVGFSGAFAAAFDDEGHFLAASPVGVADDFANNGR